MVDKVRNISRFEIRVVYTALVIILALAVYGAYNANHKSYLVCKRTEAIRAQAVILATRSNQSIKDGTTTIVGEEAQMKAKFNNDFVIHTFRPEPCDPGILGLF